MNIRENKNIVFSALSGSHAYGLNTPTSDEDYRGIFIATKEEFYGMKTPNQISDEKNDITYYELNRYLDLLYKQNPNIIELLWMPEGCIEKYDPVLDVLFEHRDKLLSRDVRNTFGGYAISQIKKARGLNKKIVNPVDEVRKTPLDFCYVVADNGSTITLQEFLDDLGITQEHCGLTALNHMRDTYGLFITLEPSETPFRGIAFTDSNELRLSSIPKGYKLQKIVFYSKDAYTRHCKEHKEYWDWVNKRNPHRYEKNIEVGKNYDTKNMMHCIRLLRMAEEMLRDGVVNVRREDRDYLLDIRNGKYEYNELIEYANNKIALLDELVETSPLPTKVDYDLINKITIKIRDTYYGE